MVALTATHEEQNNDMDRVVHHFTFLYNIPYFLRFIEKYTMMEDMDFQSKETRTLIFRGVLYMCINSSASEIFLHFQILIPSNNSFYQ